MHPLDTSCEAISIAWDCAHYQQDIRRSIEFIIAPDSPRTIIARFTRYSSPQSSSILPVCADLGRSQSLRECCIMRSVLAMAAVILVAALFGFVLPSEAGRVMLGVGSQKNLKRLLPSCSPPPAPGDTPNTPTTPDPYTPTPTAPFTSSEPSPVYSPPVDTPPAGGY